MHLHVPPERFSDYLVGVWKRNLEWREFGGSFQHLRTSNSVVLIEEDKNSLAEPQSRFLSWSFGKSIEPSDATLAYLMHVSPFSFPLNNANSYLTFFSTRIVQIKRCR
jgi:hypothetical protein